MRILGIIILAVLMGLTSWVIASVWTWLVPFYVAAIVLILVLPQGQLMDRPTPPDGYANCASGIASTADSSRELPDGVNLQGKSGHETSGLDVKADRFHASQAPATPKPNTQKSQGRA